jgi:glycosyltransferase involved in cell wall biosynthesis
MKERIRQKGWSTETGGEIDLNRVHYINNGIDLEQFDKDRECWPRADEDLRDPKTLKIVYLGSVNRANHVHTLIEAAKLLQDIGIYRFFIYGDGNDREELEKKVNDEGINNRVAHWLTLIKSDLEGDQSTIIDKIIKDESKFLKEINKFDSNKSKNNNSNVRIIEMNKYNSPLASETNKENFNFVASLNKTKKLSRKTNLWKYKYYQRNSSYYKKLIPNIRTSSEDNILSRIYKSPNISLDLPQDLALVKDYEETDDVNYRELLSKKTQYIEINSRLEQSIKEMEKTKKIKILSVIKLVEANETKLNDLKLKNRILQKELYNIQNIYNLNTFKENNKKWITINKSKDNHNDTTFQTENNILNELNNKKMYKNKSQIFEEHNIKIKKEDLIREEKMGKIKEKYNSENKQTDEILENDSNKDDNSFYNVKKIINEMEQKTEDIKKCKNGKD